MVSPAHATVIERGGVIQAMPGYVFHLRLSNRSELIEVAVFSPKLTLTCTAAEAHTFCSKRRKDDVPAHGDITHIDIPVSDLTKGAEFYSGLFGSRIAEPPGFEGYPMWQAPNQMSGGGLAPRSDDFSQPRSSVEVDSIDDTLVAAVAAGGAVLVGKDQISETSWWAAIGDPDGNVIGLYEGTTDTNG